MDLQQSSPGAAVALMMARVRPVGTERLPLEAALGRVLAEPIATDRDSPAVDVSAMDGFATRAADLVKGSLPIAGDIRIGQAPPRLPEGAALRIVTGAPVPAGADVVVKREDVQEDSGRVTVSPAARNLKAWINVRRQGENARAGAAVLAPGIEVTPPVAAALASFGCVSPLVQKRVRVGVLVTGDEVLGVGDTPTRYQLRDSNGYTVMSMVMRREWAEARRAPTTQDDPRALLETMTKLLQGVDMLIATGGVSMGERDFVPQVVRELGAEVLFHKVTQRPGKPVLGAVLPDGRPIFGLPGNPQSVMVTARRMVVPVLERLAGIERPLPPTVMRLERHDERRLDMWWHRFVRVTGVGAAALVDVSSSGDVIGAAQSDGFVEVPPGQGGEGPWPYFGWRD